jgi:hypothetical protein
MRVLEREAPTDENNGVIVCQNDLEWHALRSPECVAIQRAWYRVCP